VHYSSTLDPRPGAGGDDRRHRANLELLGQIGLIVLGRGAYGAGLDEAMYALARWGARTLGPPGPDDELHPDWGLNAFPALFNAEAARGLTETYVIRVDGDVFTVRVEDGRLEAELGAAETPDLELAIDIETFFALTSGELDPQVARAQDRLRLEGDPDALTRCFTVLSLAPRLAAAKPLVPELLEPALERRVQQVVIRRARGFVDRRKPALRPSAIGERHAHVLGQRRMGVGEVQAQAFVAEPAGRERAA
jgi:SCP-2 sterol transfer family